QITAKASFTWLRAVYDEDFVSSGNTVAKGNRIPGIPDLAAYGELAWRPVRGLTLAAETLYRSEVFVEDRNLARPAPDSFLVNLRLTARQTRGRWTFNEMLRLDNLADEKHVASVIVGESNSRFYEPGPGRTVYVGAQVGYRF